MTHKWTHLTTDKRPAEHWARCTCGFTTDRHLMLWAVDDERTEHEKYIERVKSYMGTKTPSLKQQRNYFRDMAANDPVAAHRPQWKALADELDARVNDGPPRWSQDQLL